MEWKEVRLGDFMQCNPKRVIKKGHKARKITMDLLIPHSKTINNWIYESYSGGTKFQNGDTIMARITPCLENGKHAFVSILDKGEIAYGSTEYFVFCGKENVSDNEFVYYLTKTPLFRDIAVKSMVGSSGRQRAQMDVLENLTMVVPTDIFHQHRIASVLSSLDRKIELNNKINAKLEEMAQTIFKNWFVDFEPFKDGKFVDSELGMIPEGWKVISLSEIMKYNGGSQPPASEFIDTFHEGYVRFIQIRDYYNDSHITYIPISKRNKLCDELDIMIARYGAALGRICWGLKGAYNVALAKVTPLKSYYREYLRCYLNTSYFYQTINNKGARCAQSGFNQSDINSYMIAFPIDETIVMNFNDICSSIMDKRLSLKYENLRLSHLRDTLLPKLMSGDLEVSE